MELSGHRVAVLPTDMVLHPAQASSGSTWLKQDRFLFVLERTAAFGSKEQTPLCFTVLCVSTF